MRVAVTPEGLHLPSIGAWLDPAAPVPLAILSHGHSDHARVLSGRMLATPPTVAIARERLGEGAYEAFDYEESFNLAVPGHAPARVTFLPSGHVLGSAFVLVESEGERLLYTGDTKLRSSLTCPDARVPEVDVLVTEATFGLPVFRFPEVESLRERIVTTARAALDTGQVPVYLGYALGKGPEIAKILCDAGIPVSVHGAIERMLGIYRVFGIAFPDVVPYERGSLAGRALVVPPSARRHPMVTAIKSQRVIAVTGWALLDAAYDRYDADVLVPLSDHADFDELLALVARSGARRVFTTHGFSSSLARVLRLRGLDAEELTLPAGEEE